MEELYIKDAANHRGVPIIREESYKTLISLICQKNPQKILEIGTAVGYSGMAIIKNCTGRLVTIEHEPKLAHEAAENFIDNGLVSSVCLIENGMAAIINSQNKSASVISTEIVTSASKNAANTGNFGGNSSFGSASNSKYMQPKIQNNESISNSSNLDFQPAPRVTIICDDCLVQIAQMVADDSYNNYFDFIFLDGPKAQYDKMLDGLIMLLASGGILLVDNVLFRGYVRNPSLAPNNRFKTICKRLEKFIQTFLSHPDLSNPRLIEDEDGMLVATKK